MEDEILNVAWQENRSSIIKVMGVGGGGSNAVSHMYRQGIHNVNFVICNTDAQALDASPVPVKIRMGDLGAGGDPELGRIAATDSIDKIREVLDTGTKMVFLTAGMGGGTGTGATPVIARVAKELDILTVAIVTMPFGFEGPQRIEQAKEGIYQLKDYVDSLLIINNERLREMYGDLTITEAFEKADNVLTMAARGIAELITLPGIINVDFKDVNSTMAGGGITVMGSAAESGENRARKAVEAALNSPLLNTTDISGARRMLLNIRSGTGKNQIKMDEVSEITNFVTRSTNKPSMIWGVGIDEALGDAVSVTIVATHFSNASFFTPDWVGIPFTPYDPLPIGFTPKPTGTVKVVLGWEDDISDSKTFEKPDQPQPVVQEKYFIRETSVATPAKFDCNYPDSVADVAVRPAERTRTIPFVADENMNIDVLDSIPAINRKQALLDNHLPGTEKELSKYTLATDKKDNMPRIRDNNAYLHDVVD